MISFFLSRCLDDESNEFIIHNHKISIKHASETSLREFRLTHKVEIKKTRAASMFFMTSNLLLNTIIKRIKVSHLAQSYLKYLVVPILIPFDHYN